MQTNESTYNEELLSGKADGMLSADEQASIDATLSASEHVRAELEEIRALKTMLSVRRVALIVPTPPDVKVSVMQALAQEYAQEQSAAVAITKPTASVPASKTVEKVQQAKESQSLFDIVFGWLPEPRFAFATIIVLAVAGGGAMMWNQMTGSKNVSYTAEQENTKGVQKPVVSFTEQSLLNHSAVLAGKITLQKATSSFEDLEQFFHEKGVVYPIVKPTVQAVLVGGVVSEHDGIKLAHLVYQCADKSLLYMWQVPEKMMPAAHIHLARTTMDTLDRGEWMWQSIPAKETLAMWEAHANNTAIVCSMVSDMPQQKMMALFQ